MPTDDETKLSNVVLDCEAARQIMGRFGDEASTITKEETLALLVHISSCPACQIYFNDQVARYLFSPETDIFS